MAFASHYVVYAPQKFSKVFEVPNIGKFEIQSEDENKLVFIELSSGKITRVDFAKEAISEKMVFDSVSLAKDSEGSDRFYLLFDCAESEDGTVIVVIENSVVIEVREERC